MSGSRRGARKPCAREGCRAWARRDGTLCASHEAALRRREVAYPVPSGPAASGDGGLYTHYLTEEEVGFLEKAAQRDIFGLDGEIQATTVAISRLFREGRLKDASQVAVNKARLLEARRHLLALGQAELARELEALLAETGDTEGGNEDGDGGSGGEECGGGGDTGEQE
jgi:hypothetical protein